MVTLKNCSTDIIAAHVRMGIAELETIRAAIEANDIVFGQEFDEKLKRVVSTLCVLKRILQERRFR